MKTTVSEKGQVTIPKAIRNRLGIRPGQVLELHEEGGRIVATKAVTEDRQGRTFGVLKPGRSTDRLIEELRGTSKGVRLGRRIIGENRRVLDRLARDEGGRAAAARR